MTTKHERIRIEDLGQEEAETLSEDDVRKITGGGSISDLSSTTDNTTSSVTVRGWDPKEKKAIIGEDPASDTIR